jgi:hypothetical protein
VTPAPLTAISPLGNGDTAKSSSEVPDSTLRQDTPFVVRAIAPPPPTASHPSDVATTPRHVRSVMVASVLHVAPSDDRMIRPDTPTAT